MPITSSGQISLGGNSSSGGYYSTVEGMLYAAGLGYNSSGTSQISYHDSAVASLGGVSQGSTISLSALKGKSTNILGGFTAIQMNSSVGQPFNIAISPDGLSIYSPDPTIGNLEWFTVSPTTGMNTTLSGSYTQASPNSVVVSPDGGSVYCSDNSGGYIYEYSRNTSTGALTYVGKISTPTTYCDQMVMSPDSAHLYVICGNSGIQAYSRNSSTSALTSIGVQSLGSGNTGAGVIGMTSDGQMVVASVLNSGGGGIYSLVTLSRNSSDGTLTFQSLNTSFIGTGGNNPRFILGHPTLSNVLYVTATGGLYVVSRSGYTISNPQQLTSSTWSGLQQMGITPDGLTLFASPDAAETFQGLISYSINQSNGQLSNLTTYSITNPTNWYTYSIAVSQYGVYSIHSPGSYAYLAQGQRL